MHTIERTDNYFLPPLAGGERREVMRVRLGRLGALAAVAAGAISVVSAPAANATVCSNIRGSGSSLQNIAQKEVWMNTYPEELKTSGKCTTKPTYEYNSTSSGTGLKEWGDEGAFGTESPFPAFVGTDVAPEGPAGTAGTQMNEMDKTGQKAAGEPNEVTAVPVAQSAIAVIVSLPKKCLVGKTANSPQIDTKPLSEEWAKDTVKLNELVKHIEVKAEAACEVVPTLEAREKPSGTTAGFKRFMDDIDHTTWKAFVATPKEAESTNWPFAGTKKESGTGGALAEKVFNTAGTIGYVDFADAVAKGFTLRPVKHGTAGEEYYSFISTVQNNGTVEEGATFTSPAEKEETEKAKFEKIGSNCGGAVYNTKKPENETETLKVAPNENWSGAKQSNWNGGGAVYPICTLTFDVGWQHYGYGSLKAKYEGGTFYTTPKMTAESIEAYFEWIIKIGQSTKLTEHQYSKLSTSIKTLAEEIDGKGFFKE